MNKPLEQDCIPETGDGVECLKTPMDAFRKVNGYNERFAQGLYGWDDEGELSTIHGDAKVYFTDDAFHGIIDIFCRAKLSMKNRAFELDFVGCVR